MGLLLQFVDNPGWTRWEGVKRIFHYISGTKNWKLVFGEKIKGLEGFTDTNSATQEHRHVISGYAFLIDGGTVSWFLKKKLVTLSIAKSKYVATTHATIEVLWLHQLIGKIFCPFMDSITLYSDSQATNHCTHNGSYHT